MTRLLRPLLFTSALLASGCGLFLQTDPPGMDSGPLPDAGRSDAGMGGVDAGGQCESAGDCPAPASDCERVTCEENACVVTTAVCDDGVSCTVDTCLPPGSGARCGHEPGVCPSAGGCRAATCDPTRGCLDEPIDGVCAADTYACTREFCTAEGTCGREFDDSVCQGTDSRSQCAPDGSVPFDPDSGCTLIECTGDGECIPDGTCAGDGSCEEGRCVFTPVADAPCALNDLCATGECRGGVCVEASRRACSRQCQGGSCDPATGDCRVSDDDGSTCNDDEPCTMGICNGGECESGPTCQEMGEQTCAAGTCVGNGCVFQSYCQAGQTCRSGACECVGGFEDCNNSLSDGCECPVGMGASCSATNVCNYPIADAGGPDAGRSDSGGPDAGLDAGSCPSDQIADLSGFCGSGSGLSEDCNDDGCCDCPRATTYCNTGGGGGQQCAPNMGCTTTLPDGGMMTGCPGGTPCCPCTGTCDATCPCPMTGAPPAD